MSELGGGVAGGGPLKSATVTLTAAQLKGLFGAAITLVPGVAGFAIIPRQITLNYLTGGVVFANLASMFVTWLTDTFSGVGDCHDFGEHVRERLQ